MGVCICSMFCCTLLYVHSGVSVVLMGKRELIALLGLSSWCLVVVGRLFLAVPRGCLQFVIVVFPDHTHLLFFTTADDWDCVAVVERLHALHYSVDFISCPLGSWVSLWNFETFRGSLMRPKWQKLASLAQKVAHSHFSSLVQSLIPKDILLKNIFIHAKH